MLSFHVPGVPAPKGSMKAFAFRSKEGKTRVSVTHDNKRTRPWLALVSDAAALAMGGCAVWDEALELEIAFRMPRPSSHYGKRGLRPSAPKYPDKKPDLDKLARCVKDAMEGLIYRNDSRVVSLRAVKLYADDKHGPGATVTLRPMGG